MSKPTDGYNPTAEQDQNMNNLSFDREFKLNTVEALVYNEKTNKIDRMVQPGQTLPTSGLNPSYKIYKNAAKYTVKIEEIIGSTTYTKTITRDGDNYITNISVWS